MFSNEFVGKVSNTQNFTKEEIKQIVSTLYRLEDYIFSGLADDSVFYKCPDRLRLPLIFYYGHTSCVFVNKMRLARLIEYNERINFAFEQILETGVDEMSWDDTESTRMGEMFVWPSIENIRAYRQDVLNLIMKVIDRTDLKTPLASNSPWYSMLMGIEHSRVHIETSSVLIAQLPICMVKRPNGWKYGPLKLNEKSNKIDNELITIESDIVKLGRPYDFPSFGWDNEYGEKILRVNRFKVSKFKITNEEFLEFVKDDGYINNKYWCEEGISWLKFTERRHPLFWVCDKGCKTSCGSNIEIKTHCNFKFNQSNDLTTFKRPEIDYKYRLVFDIVDMPENWPVIVNYYEAKAFCRWKGHEYRLPCEAEYKLLQNIVLQSNIQNDEVMENKTKYNTHLQFGSCTPVDMFPPNEHGIYDVCGNVSVWIEDDFDALPKIIFSKYYGDFSSPCFDGKHKIIVGGSFCSTGIYASHFARIGFRPHFQQFAGFYLLHTLTNDNDKLIRKITVEDPSNSWILSLDNQKLVDHCKVIEGIEIQKHLYDYVQSILKENLCASKAKQLVHFGCGTGQITEKFADCFKVVIGIDVQSVLLKECIKQSDSKVKYLQLTWIPNEIPVADIVICTHLHRIHDPEAWLIRLEDQVTINGHLIILIRNQSLLMQYGVILGNVFKLIKVINKCDNQHITAVEDTLNSWAFAIYKRV